MSVCQSQSDSCIFVYVFSTNIDTNINNLAKQVGLYLQNFINMSLQKFLKHKKWVRINQLPVSAAKWQNDSMICLANLILWKISRLFLTQQPLKLKKKISTDLESLQLYESLNVGFTKLKN